MKRLVNNWIYNPKEEITVSTLIDNKPLIGTKSGKIIHLKNNTPILEINLKQKLNEVEELFMEDSFNGIYSKPIKIKNNFYVASENGKIYKIDEKIKKSYNTKASIRANLTTDNKHIYFGNTNGTFYCLDLNLKPIWKYNSKKSIESEALITNTEIIFGTNSSLISLNKKGKLLWEIKTGEIITKPTIKNNIIYIGSKDNNLYLIRNGKIKEKYNTEGEILSDILIHDINKDSEKEIIIPSSNSIIVTRSNLNELWNFPTDFFITAKPIITDLTNNNKFELIVGSQDGSVYILKGAGEEIIEFIPGISGIVQQTGHYSDIISAEPVKLLGKKLFEFKLDSAVINIENIKNKIIATTRNKIYEIGVNQWHN